MGEKSNKNLRNHKFRNMELLITKTLKVLILELSLFIFSVLLEKATFW